MVKDSPETGRQQASGGRKTRTIQCSPENAEMIRVISANEGINQDQVVDEILTLNGALRTRWAQSIHALNEKLKAMEADSGSSPKKGKK